MRSLDYTEPGEYFVTICTEDRACLFGDVEDGAVRLNAIGRVVHERWLAIPTHHAGVQTDAFVVMPNHVHGILRIVGTVGGSVNATEPDVGATPASPHRAIPARGPRIESLASIVGSFKSGVTRRLRQDGQAIRESVWQRGFHEHVIRDERSLERIRAYIAANPARWADDPENPRGRSDGGATQASPLQDDPWSDDAAHSRSTP